MRTLLSIGCICNVSMRDKQKREKERDTGARPGRPSPFSPLQSQRQGKQRKIVGVGTRRRLSLTILSGDPTSRSQTHCGRNGFGSPTLVLRAMQSLKTWGEDAENGLTPPAGSVPWLSSHGGATEDELHVVPGRGKGEERRKGEEEIKCCIPRAHWGAVKSAYG